ncbi:MAG TPA: XdhC family protein [Saprospiraceae bacterium]|nr:XdhC family protein [Saprospiraceae bacterium]
MYYQDMLPLLEKVNEPIVICTVVSTKGSTPRKAGAKMMVTKSGRIFGTVGGGEFERKVIEEALDVVHDGEARLCRHELLQQHDMCCGGVMEVFIERVGKKPGLYLFGAGHIGMALSKFAAELDFDVTVVDDRGDFLEQCKQPGVKIMEASIDEALAALEFTEETMVVIMTYKHDLDRRILAHVMQKPHRYLGMIGSRRKVLLTKKRFRDQGVATLDEMDEVDMPVGLPIGANGPKEIAISILAKLIAVRNHVEA